MQTKAVTLVNIKQLLKKLVEDIDAATLEDITQKAQQLSQEFNNIVTETWTKLMTIEVDLHEQIQVYFLLKYIIYKNFRLKILKKVFF